MKIYKYWLWILVLGFMAGCRGGTDQKENTQEDPGSGEFSFVANPVTLEERDVSTLEPGDKAPDFKLPGVDNRYYSLEDFSDSQVLVIVFTCNHCPTAQAYEERIKSITRDYKDKGVALVAISPNSPIALLPEECGYSDLEDSFEDMRIRARDHGFNFPYLYDGDDHSVSIKYGPKATPHVFVFDENRTLQYTGRIDGSEKPGTANGEDLRNAIDRVLAGEKVESAVTKSFGCSVKWSWKNEWTLRVNKEWAEKEVTLKDIDVAGVEELIANESDKLRLINFWATWCGPCIIEYPEFVMIHRMFKERPFEFISVSTDKPEKRDEALRFLKEKNSALTNYIFAGEKIYDLINDKELGWDGSLPFTLLVEPGGKVVYKANEAVDPLELKRAIVDHPLIGRYY